MKLSDEDYQKLTEAVDGAVWTVLGDKVLTQIVYQFSGQLPEPVFNAVERGVREALTELSTKVRIFVVAHIADVKEP